MESIVIIGLSAAGISCLDTLIKYLPQCKITAISNEKENPYSRCLLTYYLSKSLKEKDLTIRKTSNYPNNINFILGEKAQKIDVKKKIVLLSNGKEIPYTKVLIATGSSPIKPAYYNEKNKTFSLRYLKDAKNIDSLIDDNATIVGGGFIGIKTAIAFLERKINPNVIVASNYPLSQAIDEETARYVEKDLKAMGINFLTSDDIVSIKKGLLGKNISVSLKSGKDFKTNLVVVGKGTIPECQLAKDSHIKISQGIETNEYLETSEPNIFAAGDCAETIDIVSKTKTINALWTSASEQGYFVALNMLNKKVPYPGSMKMNSLKTKGLSLVSAGILKGNNLVEYKKFNSITNQFKKITLKDNVLVGMAFLNYENEAGLFVNLIKQANPLKVSPEKLINGEINIADLLLRG